jgi:hypothetical protein
MYNDSKGPQNRSIDRGLSLGSISMKADPMLPTQPLALSIVVSTALSLLGLLIPPAAAQAPRPLFDAHIHFSHDAAQQISTDKVLALMREAGLRRAMVSSSDDEGTQKLHKAAPDLIVPSLRPYRLRNDALTWTSEPAIVAYLEQRLAKYQYAAIGEFHLYGSSADLPVPKRMIELSQQYRLILHAHSDADAIDRIFKQAPRATVLWAHSGFESPEAVRTMLHKHPRLFADLAYRTDQASPEWTNVFKAFPERFVLGTDTFTPERLFYIPEHARFSRAWLAHLPEALAERIAFKNGDALLHDFWPPRQASACTGGKDRTEAGQARALVDLRLPSIKVSEAFQLQATLCPNQPGDRLVSVTVDASMPEHQHGMNYKPRVTLTPLASSNAQQLSAQGMLFHMPGRWQIEIQVFGQDAQGKAWAKPEVLRFQHRVD